MKFVAFGGLGGVHLASCLRFARSWCRWTPYPQQVTAILASVPCLRRLRGSQRTSTASVPEPAWHRNLRKKRQLARGIVAAAGLGFAVDNSRVAAAAARLCGHHGSAMVPSLATAAPGRKADWYCHKCGIDKVTFGKFDNCHFCGGAKRICHGGPAPKKASGGVRDRPSTAQRQVEQQRKADRAAKTSAAGAAAFDKRVAELQSANAAKDKLLKAANAEVKQLKAAVPAAVAAEPPGDSFAGGAAHLQGQAGQIVWPNWGASCWDPCGDPQPRG